MKTRDKAKKDGARDYLKNWTKAGLSGTNFNWNNPLLYWVGPAQSASNSKSAREREANMVNFGLKVLSVRPPFIRPLCESSMGNSPPTVSN